MIINLLELVNNGEIDIATDYSDSNLLSLVTYNYEYSFRLHRLTYYHNDQSQPSNSGYVQADNSFNGARSITQGPFYSISGCYHYYPIPSISRSGRYGEHVT